MRLCLSVYRHLPHMSTVPHRSAVQPEARTLLYSRRVRASDHPIRSGKVGAREMPRRHSAAAYLSNGLKELFHGALQLALHPLTHGQTQSYLFSSLSAYLSFIYYNTIYNQYSTPIHVSLLE